MVIDDSPIIRQLVSMTASQGGYQVIQAENGQDAINKLKPLPAVNLFVCDVNMPIMDGITCVTEIRKMIHYRSIPIIMLTTESQEDKKAKGKLAGATGWVVKPFEQGAFLKILQRLMG